MSESTLSSDARRRLWQCYELLIRLADKNDVDDTIEPEIENDPELAETEEEDDLLFQSKGNVVTQS